MIVEQIIRAGELGDVTLVKATVDGTSGWYEVVDWDRGDTSISAEILCRPVTFRVAVDD